jgi:hypothetical protein
VARQYGQDMRTTIDRPAIAQPRTPSPRHETPASETWMGMAIAAHMFERPATPISAPPIASHVDQRPTGHAAGPAWPAFRAAPRPKHARYLSFADREHLLRYAQARAEMGS